MAGLPKYDIPTLKSEYFVFDGAIDKKTYLNLFLKLFITVFVVSFVVGFITGLIGMPTLGMLISLPLAIIGLIGSFSIAIRRLKDIGKPPIFSLVLLVPFFNILLIIYLAITDTGGANSII